ncbi:MAG TPA: thiamine pyrophosphate-dependent dehydrogenase E1 component subunit alpha [Polyangia bacterium]|nr:thiamine pyrophosphate-dependent dehydrogenase E1 component subunit alpha [Polyangia bacterium]
MTNEVFSVLDDDGNVLHPEHEPTIAPEDLLRIYRGMLLVRLMDERMLRLQRQGRLGFYMTSTGEEATHFGGAYPLRDSDWIFPSYREPGAAFWRGYGLREFICQLMGNAEDPIKGRQMPVHHSVRRINYVSISSPVGTQIPQAVGVAHAAKIRKRDDVALVYFGEGGTSTGAFHVALNFAGVFKLPVIFFCRNNGWAISTARERQTAARTFAAKAVAYGLPGVRVDGNDVLAIVSVMNQALARARGGAGATLIEAVTYRRGAHSSSDDPSVYRDPSEPKKWEHHDPIGRFQRYLERRGLMTAQLQKQLQEEIGGQITAALKSAEAVPGKPPIETMFADVFAHVPPHLLEQLEQLQQAPRSESTHH